MATLDAKEGDRAALAEAQQGASIFDKCNERIARMDGCSARRVWGQWKKPLLAMARAHQSKVREE